MPLKNEFYTNKPLVFSFYSAITSSINWLHVIVLQFLKIPKIRKKLIIYTSFLVLFLIIINFNRRSSVLFFQIKLDIIFFVSYSYELGIPRSTMGPSGCAYENSFENICFSLGIFAIYYVKIACKVDVEVFIVPEIS